MANSYKIKTIVGTVLACALFGFIIHATPMYTHVSSCNQAAMIFTFIFLLSLLPILINNQISLAKKAVLAFIIAGIIFIRICFLFFESYDFTDFLTNWIKQMSKCSNFFDYLQQSTADYNIPYLLLLFIVSKLKFLDILIAVKAISTVFDVYLAFNVYRIVKLRNDTNIALASYFVTLALPTIVLNSSMWGQCDSIFSSMCLASFYYLITNNNVKASVMWSLAFAFKLQAIFMFPVIVFFILVKRLKLIKFILSFISVNLFALIPGFASIGIKDTLLIYINQANEYPRITFNLPNIWTLFNKIEFVPLSTAAVFITGFCIFSLLYFAYENKNNFDTNDFTALFFLSAFIMPFILPRMHDRYYYLAGAVSIIYAFYDKKKWYVPVVLEIASFCAYSVYGIKIGQSPIDFTVLTVSLIFLLIKCIIDFYSKLKYNNVVGEIDGSNN